MLTALVAVGVLPLLANGCRSVAASQVHFGLHRLVTWRERRNEPFWPQWRRFQVLKLGLTLAKQASYVALVAVGVNYLAAYITCALVAGVLSFGQFHKRVFGGDEPEGVVPNPLS